ncbi:Acyltransferase family protein [Tritrichomonas foetus]|uniref:Acyltransferase family protein n=1 Tax=Tritrichomonas foetus TaxID=1144522 RepID=A0A1J4KS75_9EUKA|nr:Acyltransferase family protein [Tritrichomonas foetus]|eukprot:OHT13954.1 Acyltransferase family protein [Tritrichomonas foetus]
MKFKCEIPPRNPSFTRQEKLSPVSDELFKEAITGEELTDKDFYVQLFMFIFGFGWIRIIILLFATIIFVPLIAPLPMFYNKRKFINFYMPFAEFMTRIYVRIMLFTLGVSWVRIHGKRDRKVRGLAYNHTSLIDGPLVFIYHPFTPVITIGVRKIPVIGRLLESGETIWIDRQKTEGNSKLIVNRMHDHNTNPVAVAPEGKITNGKMMFKFRTGQFLTDEPIQPISLRYTNYFSFAKTNFNFTRPSVKEFLWLCLCIPFGVIDLTFLPTLSHEVMKDRTPEERAEICQLEIANDLGVLAGSRTSKELFIKKSIPPTINKNS